MNEKIKKRLEGHIKKRNDYVLSHPHKKKQAKKVWKNKFESRDKIYSKCISEGDFCVEVGVRQGENAALMYLQKPSVLHLVDMWATKHHSDNRSFYKIVTDLFEDIENVHIHKEWSVQASEKFKKKTIDFIYIDAGHRYEEVKKDINAWFPKVKVGGYIAGDDYVGNKNKEKGLKWQVRNYGVIEAIDELIATGNVEIVYFDEKKTFPLPGAGQFALRKIKHVDKKVLGEIKNKPKNKRKGGKK